MSWNNHRPVSGSGTGSGSPPELGETARPVDDLGRELDALNERLRRSQERMRQLLEHRRADGPDGQRGDVLRTSSPAPRPVVGPFSAPTVGPPPADDDPFGNRPPSVLSSDDPWSTRLASGLSSAGSPSDPFADVPMASASEWISAESSTAVIDLREVAAEPLPPVEPDVWSGSRRTSAVRVGATSMTWAKPGPLVADPIWGPPTAVTSNPPWTAPAASHSVTDPVWSPEPAWLPPPLPPESPWVLTDQAVSPGPLPQDPAVDEPESLRRDVSPSTTRPGWQSNLITLMVALVVLIVALVFVGAI